MNKILLLDSQILFQIIPLILKIQLVQLNMIILLKTTWKVEFFLVFRISEFQQYHKNETGQKSHISYKSIEVKSDTTVFLKVTDTYLR